MTSPHDYDVRTSRDVFTGRVISVRTDIVGMPGGGESQRDVIEHPGAVGVVVLNPRNEVLLLRQYRHPVRRHLWELPAGLLDKPGEPALEAARRELYEEGHLRAADWRVLVDAHTSPGMTDEAIRLFLARDVTDVEEADRYAGSDEEAEMELEWVPLETAVRRVLDGGITNAMAALGLLAAARAALDDYRSLRPADVSWPDGPSATASGSDSA